MGHQTILHGYIVEEWRTSPLDYSRLNDERIAALPEWTAETNPLVSCDMFATPRYGYLGRIIPFGRSYSGVEGHWQRWRDGFEALLRTLYWVKVQVWVETENWGDYHCTWTKRTPDPEQDAGVTEEAGEDDRQVAVPDEPLGPTEDWYYCGPERNVVR